MKIKFHEEGPLLAQLNFNSNDRDLDLSTNLLNRRTQEELLSMIKKIAAEPIESLSLSTTGLQLKSANEIAILIKALKFSSVKKFDLSNNWLGFVKSGDDVKMIMGAMVGSSFEELNLSNNSLGSLDVPVFIDVLKILSKTALESIQMDDNYLDRLGGPAYVAQLFAHNLRKKVIFNKADFFSTQVMDSLESFVTSPVEVALMSFRG